METNFQPPSTPLSQLTINEAENDMNQELNDSELDAIAGGLWIGTLALLASSSTSSTGTVLSYPSVNFQVIYAK